MSVLYLQWKPPRKAEACRRTVAPRRWRPYVKLFHSILDEMYTEQT